MVLTSVTRPAAGARSDVGAWSPAAGGTGLCRRRRQPGQFLVVGDHVAFADQDIGDPGSLLIDPDHRFLAWHYKAGNPHHVGEAGIGGFRHDDERVARSILLLGLGTMLKPIKSAEQSSHEGHG